MIIDMTDNNTVGVAEAKQREAMRREREAEDNEKMVRIEIESKHNNIHPCIPQAADGERNVHRLCDQMLVNGRQRLVINSMMDIIFILYSRGDVQREKEREERRVAEISQNLERYKREIGNCQTAAREMRAEEARMNDLHDKYLEEADKAERQARLAEEEAAR